MTAKVHTSIYKIDDERISYEDLKDEIVKKKYKEQTLAFTTKNGYCLSLFYSKMKSSPDWKEFFTNIVASGQQIFQKVNNEGFVFLLKNAAGSIYALAGGLGYFAIQDYIEPEFGLNILAKIIKKDEKILKSVRENSVLGGVQGSILFFRKDYNLLENEDFGKIYQELKACIDKQTLVDRFGFNLTDLKNSPVCLAKASFRLNKRISFEEILKIISGCESILSSDAPGIQINSVNKLDKKRDVALINSLQEQLEEKIWQKFKGETLDEKFDLCHREFEKYLTASKYEIRKGASKNPAFDLENDTSTSLELVLKKIEESDQFNIEDEDCKSDFIEYLNKLYLLTFDNSAFPRTKGRIFDHLFAELEHDQKRYFFINGTWYLISEDFLDSLNTSCRSFLSSQKAASCLVERAWNYAADDSENDFNKAFIGDDKTIVLDKITPDNIEPCDILKWDEESVFLIHVKAGFDGSMRDLSSQVLIAASTIQQDVKSGKNYLKKIYQDLLAKKGSSDNYFNSAGMQTDVISEEEFCALFDRKLIFVIGVLDTAVRQRQIENVESFNSNIAKFSAVELFKQMKALGIELQVCQIRKGI